LSLSGRTLKKYIKTLSCYPELCTPDEYKAIMTDFKNSEKVRGSNLIMTKQEIFLNTLFLFIHK
jgi:hypothetical protein